MVDQSQTRLINKSETGKNILNELTIIWNLSATYVILSSGRFYRNEKENCQSIWFQFWVNDQISKTSFFKIYIILIINSLMPTPYLV